MNKNYGCTRTHFDWEAGKVTKSPTDVQFLRDWDMRTTIDVLIGRATMAQRVFHIELKVDYADPGKNKPMEAICTKLARHGIAMAHLLSDGIRPQAVVYHEDNMTGFHTIDIMADAVQGGLEALTDVATCSQADDDTVSAEMIAALKEGK